MKNLVIGIVGVVALAYGHQAFAQPCSGKSPAHTLALVELYTSEGCDSCPPADKWLRTMASPPLAGSVVPLALHVDYWDYIGWKDPLARPQFSARQRELSAVQGRGFVYTPQIVLAGRDYRQWGKDGAFFDAVKKTNARPARANIEISVLSQGKGRIEARADVQVADAGMRVDAVLHIAVFQNGLATAVAAGENRGKTLQHDFVARAWSGPVSVGSGGRVQASVKAVLPGATAARAGIAAFVQNRRNGEVLQAFAMPLCTN